MRIVVGCVALCVVLFATSTATAGSVSFAGQVLTNNAGGGAGSAFGTLPPTVSFSTAALEFTDGGMSGNLVGGAVFSSHPNISILSGSLQLTEAGSSDTAIVALQISRDGGGANGNITMTFTGDLFASAVVNQATIDSLIASADNSGSFTYIDNGGGQSSVYSGNSASFAAVPEPSTAGLLLGLAGMSILRRRRKA